LGAGLILVMPSQEGFIEFKDRPWEAEKLFKMKLLFRKQNVLPFFWQFFLLCIVILKIYKTNSGRFLNLGKYPEKSLIYYFAT
jgi:hypothetical protein